MNYLMYYLDGFIKKFPLEQTEITIGRNPGNHLVIQEDFISREHVKVIDHGNHIMVQDLGSTNGIYAHGENVNQCKIKTGQSFVLGKMEFVLKRGTLEEFQLTDALIPIFTDIADENQKLFDNVKTRYIRDIYNEILKVVLQVGMKKNHFNDFILDIPNHLSHLSDTGSLFIISQSGDSFDILLSVKQESLEPGTLKKVIQANPAIFNECQTALPLPREYIEPVEGKPGRLFSYPLDIHVPGCALLFILSPRRAKEEANIREFLPQLVTELELLSRLLRKQVPKSAPTSTAGDDHPGDADCVAESKRMKEILKQARKIAGSDIFVLVQGESGTGKELVARLIHRHSRRSGSRFVAINCAAIPENLLESELFGHERGAFTGAYTQKKGKLEIASGGTLVLDEIGDMPLNLQARLLRALQENEFYRLGGTQPIKVNLRIISITNRDLKKLIEEGAFREDLYYRLVHRTITIPPLRERKEDISALINFFTQKFCRESRKKIKGYAIKAFEALQAFHWKGNIRQLENEIRSIVNLTDDAETVRFDILSDEVRENRLPASTREAVEVIPPPGYMDEETEKKYILQLLEKNRWNKSQTARDLGMTYQGLHKKLKRMDIRMPEQ